MIKIVIADDHLIIRQGLRLILETEDDFTLVGEKPARLDSRANVEDKIKPKKPKFFEMMPNKKKKRPRR